MSVKVEEGLCVIIISLSYVHVYIETQTESQHQQQATSISRINIVRKIKERKGTGNERDRLRDTSNRSI